jgi:hypothetical protein
MAFAGIPRDAERQRAEAQNRSFSPILSRVTSQPTSQGLESAANLRPNVSAVASFCAFAECPGSEQKRISFFYVPLCMRKDSSHRHHRGLAHAGGGFLQGDASGIFRRLHGDESTIAELPGAPFIANHPDTGTPRSE